jgi:signal transduction histidine kinase
MRDSLGLDEALAKGTRRQHDVWISRRRTWLRGQSAPIATVTTAIVGAVLVLATSPRERGEQRLVRSHEQLRSLSAHFQRAAELSRAGLARELHDELGALLTALKLDLAWLESKLGPKAADAAERAHEAGAVSDLAIAAVRRDLLGAPSFGPRIARPARGDRVACRELQKRSGLQVRVEVPSEELEIEGTVAILVFRILQEATTNVLRHAQPGIWACGCRGSAVSWRCASWTMASASIAAAPERAASVCWAWRSAPA